MEDFAIKIEKVSKDFKLPREKESTIKSVFVNFYRRRRGYDLQHALNNVSLEIKKGEFFGIVGRNGSGKSTLLKLLAGIYSPSEGQVHIYGSLTPFIELGVGFNMELTGRENVFLNGALLGFNRKEMQAMYKDIVEFAELQKFMDQKLKNYSSGMQVRLAFSIAIRAKSDILLIDEVLAVGDSSFQSKCFEYFRTLKNSSKTVIFVSHDRGAIQEFCDKAALIEEGSLVSYGNTYDVLKAYDRINMDRLDRQNASKDESKRWGEGGAKITACEVLRNGQPAKAFMPGDEITIRITVEFEKDTASPVYGLVVNRIGEPPVFATNTKAQDLKTKDVIKSEKVTITYSLKNVLGSGRYQVSPAVASADTLTMYDWRDGMKQFNSTGWDDQYLPVHIEHEIKVGS